MKRFLIFLLLPALLLPLAACGGGVKPADDGRLTVVCTIFPPYDFVRELSGGTADVSILLPAGGDPHSFEPSPKEILRIKNCDLFLYIGGESDAYIEDLLASFDTPPRSLALMQTVSLLAEETVEGMDSGNEPEEEEGAPDEHIWTSMANCIEMCRAIRDELCAIDPENSPLYATNFERYQSDLSALDSEFSALAATSRHRTLIFGDRFPFRYFADRYGFDYYAAFPGCSSESEPSAATVSFLIGKVRDEGIPTVFYTETSNHAAADSIAEYTGAKTALLHSCHNLSEADRAAGMTFLSLWRQNLETLKGALTDAGDSM